MPKTIICSVGTSASKKLNSDLKKLDQQLKEWIEERKPIKNAAKEMFETFRSFEPSDENLAQHLSAEIHSLVRMGLDSSDRVLLLTSETDDGYCCGLAVEEYLKYYWSSIEVNTERINGLQVFDADKFRNQGVVEFVKKGGYKALVPYTVLLGMLKNVKCNYIFERSTSLLELPPLPVEFKRSQFETYKDIFEKIDRDSYISQQDWDSRVPYEERSLLEPLIEQSSEGITLSAVGFLFLEEMRQPSALVPFLSRKAIDDCFDNVAQLDDCDPFRFLQRVASSQNAFTQAEHINVGDGLRWLKPGRTTDRYLVSVEGWRLLVWRVIREDQEGANYPQTIQVNPDRDRARYAPFLRMEYVN